jgi:hypothetical protein
MAPKKSGGSRKKSVDKFVLLSPIFLLVVIVAVTFNGFMAFDQTTHAKFSAYVAAVPQWFAVTTFIFAVGYHSSMALYSAWFSFSSGMTIPYILAWTVQGLVGGTLSVLKLRKLVAGSA